MTSPEGWARVDSRRGAMVITVATALLLVHPPVLGQAPPSPDRPWPIPESASARAAQVGDRTGPVPEKQYGLAELIDLAERTNPRTRAAWETARAAAAAEGLVESQFLPQLSFEALGGYEHTPLPAPKDLVPKGYFESKRQELFYSLGLE